MIEGENEPCQKPLLDLAFSRTYRLTKQQLHLEVNERLAKYRPENDPQAAELWQRRLADGTIRAYMEKVTARK